MKHTKMIVNTWQHNTWDERKKQLQNALQASQTEILKIAETLQAMPELAYQEDRTSQFIQDWMRRVGIVPHVSAHTGVYGDIGVHPPEIAIVADMDGIEVDGAVTHACGHHAQIVHLLGTMLVFSAIQPLDRFGLRFIATPAEELLKSEKRNTLLRSDSVCTSSGKAWMAKEGVFNGIKSIMSCHLADDLPERSVCIGYQTKGCMVIVLSLPTSGFSKESELLWQMIQKKTKEWNESEIMLSHAGAKIDSIVDLSSLQEGMVTVYITSDVPEQFEGIRLFANRLMQAIQTSRLDGIKILDVCEAYAPLKQDSYLSQMFSKHARDAGYEVLHNSEILEGYTDLGFLSQEVAVCHPMIGGTSGVTHSLDFRVVDPYAAYIMPIQVLTGLIVELCQ